MFEVHRDVGPFGSCALIDTASHSRVKIAPERGGIVTEFALAGRPILYLDEASLLDTGRSVRGGIPILFPICGNLPDDTYRIGGTPYRLKQHGLARLLPWRVVAASTTDAAALTLALTSDDQTFAAYPFDFEVRFTYTLAGGRLTIAQEYHNRSATAMPMAAGFHPYFVCSDKRALTFEIPATHYRDQVSGEAREFHGFPFEEPVVDWIFTDVHGQKASVTNPADGYRLQLEYDPVFRCLVFWTLSDKDFYCLEPWMAPRNALNTGQDLVQVEPGTSLGCRFVLDAALL